MRTLLVCMVIMAVLMVWGLVWWDQKVEPRLFRPAAPPDPRHSDTREPLAGAYRGTQRPLLPEGEAGHVAFALALQQEAAALTFAADQYLAECEERAARAGGRVSGYIDVSSQ